MAGHMGNKNCTKTAVKVIIFLSLLFLLKCVGLFFLAKEGYLNCVERSSYFMVVVVSFICLFPNVPSFKFLRVCLLFICLLFVCLFFVCFVDWLVG